MPEQTDNIDSNDSNETEIVCYLKKHSIPLKSIAPADEDYSDLELLKQLIGDARIVGLGEATHGSHEFAQVRDHLARFMIREMNFNGVIMEVPGAKAEKVDEYIHEGKGEVYSLLSGLEYWVDNIQEVVDMVEWMKKYNQDNPQKQISFKGCDIPTNDKRREKPDRVRDKAMAENCIKFTNENGANLKFALWSHNHHVAYQSFVDLPENKTQGSYLHDLLGDGYINFGTIFNEGSFNAVNFDDKTKKFTGLKQFEVPSLGKQSYANFFEQAGYSYSITDLRQIISIPAFEKWHESYYKQRIVGAVYIPTRPENMIVNIPIAKQYDALIWIDKITASKLLPFQKDN